MGRRLRYATNELPKCMLAIAGETLIERSLGIISRYPLSRIIIVVGYKSDELKKHLGNSANGVPIIYVENPVYSTTNNIYSLFLTRDYLRQDDTLLLESDLIFEKSIIDRIMADKRKNIAVVDKYKFYMDGSVIKISPHQSDDFDVAEFIPKALFDIREIHNYYKTVNIYKFSREFSDKQYVPFLESYCSALGHNMFYEQVLKVILALEQKNIKALVLNGEKWYEIDSIPDMRNAELLFSQSKPEKYELYNKRYGGYWVSPNLKDFCYLVNPYFNGDRIIEEFKANFKELLTSYPSGQSMQCIMAGEFLAVNDQYVAVGNGASEIIAVLADLLPGKCGVMTPTFLEYPARLGEENIVPLTPDNDIHYGTEPLKKAIGKIDYLLLINPDNPSGNFIPREELLELVEFYQKEKKWIILDESFVDFAIEGGPHTLLEDDIIKKFDNLIIIKSISKSYGVPGLRLGITASGNLALIEKIRKSLAIWNINSFAEFYLHIGAKYRSLYHESCENLARAREAFLTSLSVIPGLKVWPSQANYLLCQLTNGAIAYELAENLLYDHDLYIKAFDGRKGLDGEFIRLAVRTTSENMVLVKTLGENLATLRQWQ